MLALSKTTGYAIAALSCLDGPGGQTVSVQDVANCTQISKSYLSKIIQTLAEKKFVKTKRGYTGGLLLMRPPEEISLKEIVEAMEGPNWIGNCLLGWGDCKETCPTHEFWKQERERIVAELRARKLVEFTRFKSCTPGTPKPDQVSETEIKGGSR